MMRPLIQFFFCFVFFFILSASCKKLTPDGYGQEANEFFKTESPQSTIEDEIGHLSLIFGKDSTNVKGLESFLRSFSRVRFLDSESDRVVVVLGITSYEESLRAFEEIDGYGFNVVVKDNQLIIVGSDETWTALALYALEDALLSNENTLKDSVLVIPSNLHIKHESKDPQLIAHLIHEGYSFTLQSDMIVSCPGQGVCNIPQGVTSDGESIYFIFRDRTDTRSVVFKYDFLTLEKTGQSVVLNTGHSNDMTFNPDIQSLIIAHGMSQGNALTIVNTNSLSFVDKKQIDVGVGAITFNEKRQQYALSQGGTTFYLANPDFNILQSFTRQKMNGYTAQGMGSDDSFVYFPMSGNRKNILLAYDWEGNLASTLDLGIPYESESMFYANGDYYVCCNRSGAALYCVKPRLCYSFNGRENQ